MLNAPIELGQLAALALCATALAAGSATAEPDARRYAYKHCHANDVDDAVQESLLVISRKVKGLKAAAAFSAWLFTVIKRECHRLERMMFKHDPLPDEATEELLARRSYDTLRVDLANPLESLPAHYLEVVLLRDFEELTIAEIAERLSEPQGAVKSRLHRARELVREYMLGPDITTSRPPTES
jgi:RNA polymerase sigma factor (sigma-70 family)